MTDLATLRHREAAAERQRVRRARKKVGVTVVSVEISWDVLDALNDAGLVDWNEGDRNKIAEAATIAINRWADVTRDGDESPDVVEQGHDDETE